MKACLAAAAMCLGAAVAALANKTPVEVPANGIGTLGNGPDLVKNGTGTGGGNGNSPGDDFTRLDTVITLWNSHNPTDMLPTPIITGDTTVGTGSDALAGYDYAVVHYGAGPGGTASGGVEIFYLNGDTGSYTFPQNGSGPNGNGGISSVVLFEGDAVPDGGTAVLMLGAVLTGLGLLRRKAGG
jgi:hypothetical protein